MNQEAIRQLIALLTRKRQLLIMVNKSVNPLYATAKLSLGKHMTLNEAVPAEVGCAEAVSAVLSLVGVSTGSKGIPGTASLYKWLLTNPKFTLITSPEPGAIIVSPTGMGNGKVVGHTGILGGFNTQYKNDWGIMSNDSATGLFLERWSLTRWNTYYGNVGGLPVYLFKYNVA